MHLFSGDLLRLVMTRGHSRRYELCNLVNEKIDGSFLDPFVVLQSSTVDHSVYFSLSGYMLSYLSELKSHRPNPQAIRTKHGDVFVFSVVHASITVMLSCAGC